MTKKRMIEILLLAAEKHRIGQGVCTTLSVMGGNEQINYDEFVYVKNYLRNKFSYNPNFLYWLSDWKNNFYKDNKKGTQHRINMLLDAAARVEIYGVK